MTIIKHFFVTLTMVFAFATNLCASDSIRVSVLTCAPGNEVYELYGHTALRVTDERSGMDLAFNYGMFSFNTPNFVMRFVEGQTDYQLGIIPFDQFLYSYQQRGSAVKEQVLAMNMEEKERLIQLLRENYLPQNRIYRYNFFYDNCTTRARDMVEKALERKVAYAELKKDITFRDIIHEFNAEHPWSRLGVDFCLGSEADQPIVDRQKMFAPFYLFAALEKATITDSLGKPQPFVEETITYDAQPRQVEAEFPISPMTATLLLALVVALAMIVGWKHGKVLTATENVLFIAQGAAGCVVAFLFFLSSHPTVGSNWLVVLFNPLPLFYPLLSLRRGWRNVCLYANLSVAILFLFFFWLCPQDFEIEMLLLALILLLASVNHLVRSRYRKHEE